MAQRVKSFPRTPCRFSGADKSSRGLDSLNAVTLSPESLHFAVLDDVDPQYRRPVHSPTPPRHGGQCHPAVEANLLELESGHYRSKERNDLPNGFLVEKLGVNAMDAHRVSTTGKSVPLTIGMVEIEHAPLADHSIVVDVLLESLPKFHGLLVERDVAGQQVVRPDNRRIAADVTAADPAFLTTAIFFRPNIFAR